MIRGLLTIVLLASFLAVSIAGAAEAGQGVISGELINKTPGGGSVANQTVNLFVYVDNQPADGPPGMTSDASGKFQFSGLATAANYTYQVAVNYQGAVYLSDGVVFGADTSAKSIQIPVYEPTRSSDGVRVVMSHLVVYPEGDSLRVTEYYVMANKGDRTYVGPPENVSSGGKGVLRFMLPKGAADLELGPGLMPYEPRPGELYVVDPMPVAPGMREVVFGYRLPFTDRKYAFYRTLDYPTDAYRVLVENSALDASSPSLSEQGQMDIQGKTFKYLLGRDMAAGARMTVDFAGTGPSDTMGIVRWAGIGLLVAAIAAGVAYPLLRRRRTAVAGADPSQQLVEEIAALDRDFEEGLMPEQDYQRQRAAKKSALRQIMEGQRRR